MRHLYALLEPFELMNLYYWQIIDVFIFGFLTRTGGVGQQHLVLTCLALFYFVARMTIDTTISFFRELMDASFTGLMATPVRTWQLLAGLYTIGTFGSICAVTVIASAIYLFFNVNVFVLGWWIIPCIFLLMWSGIALATFVLAFLLTFGKKDTVIYAASWSLIPFCGVFYPVTIMPIIFQKIALGIPVYYVMTFIRTFLTTGQHSPIYFLAATLLNTLYFALALWVFNRALRARKEIGLPRLESET